MTRCQRNGAQSSQRRLPWESSESVPSCLYRQAIQNNSPRGAAVRLTMFVLSGVLCLVVLAAQTTKTSASPVSDTVRELLAGESKNLIGAAELMPADTYGYHPTPEQMTFGQLIAHIVQTNVALCSLIADTPLTELPKLSDTDQKDALVNAIKGSFETCTAGLAKVNDAQLGDELTMGGRKVGSRAKALITIATDWADHYSTAASYLRLNGILPPTAKPRK
jgi:hypothetical protein